MELFKPDIFSTSSPNWIKSTSFLENHLGPVIRQIVPPSSLKECVIEYSGSIEINSSNFRLSFNDKKYILKKWSTDKDIKSVSNIEKIVLFLKDHEIPVPSAVPFLNNQMILEWDSNLWTCSTYISGDYYSGKNNQLKEASVLTAKTANILYQLPQENLPKESINPQIDHIEKIIKKTEELRSNWEQFFGREMASLLIDNWHKINQLCVSLNRPGIEKGKLFPNHYDMHPHNLLFDKSQPVSLLDFDSIVSIHVGYSIAYSALKQCRQFVSRSNELNMATKAGKKYLNYLKVNLKMEDLKWLNNLRALAQIETLRRISVILQLNHEGNNLWNKVMPVLISHLYEAEELFD